MNKKSVLITIVTVLASSLILSSLFSASVKASPGIELYYDDGTAEYHWSWNGAGCMFAVRFTPTTTGQLTNCSFYIAKDPDNFLVTILDANKDEIVSLSAVSSINGWLNVDVSTWNITVTQDVDFYVAMETTTANIPKIGDDLSAPDGRSWDYNGNSWAPYDDGDYMIRATIEPMPDLVVTDLYWDPSEPETGEDVTFYAEVENQGGGNANGFVLQIYLDGELFAEGTDTLVTGDNTVYTNTLPWEATGGEHTVRFVLDPTDVIDETDENNNEMSQTFTVGEQLIVVSPYGTPSGEGWYDQATTAYATLDTDIVDYGNGTRRVFTHWSGDASGTNYAQSDPIYMDGPKTAIANWKTQYYLTMNAENGTVTPGSGWYDEGATVQISATDPTGTTDERYAWQGWIATGTGSYSGTDKTATLTINSPITQTATWNHEYYLTVTSPYGTPSFSSGWVEAGSQITLSVTSSVSGPAGTRYACNGWTGTGSVPTSGTTSSTTFTINAPSSIIWSWKTQYYLTMNADSGTVTPSSGWYDEGTTVQISATDPTGTADERYAWTAWTGTGTGSYSGTSKPATVTMNEPITETAAWRHEYYLTVTSPYGTTTPSGWIEAGKSITVSANSPASGTSDTRYLCTGWTGTGCVLTSGTTGSASFTMDETSSITWNWKTQYYLTMNAVNGSVTPGDGWYDAGSTVQIIATDPPAISGGEYSWSGWTGTGTGSYNGMDRSATITMNEPRTETAVWEWEFEPKLSTSINLTLPPEPISEGKTITVSGEITPAHEATVTLTYTKPNGVEFYRTFTSLPNGKFSQNCEVDTKGLWSVTANCLEDADYLGATSTPKQFTVGAPPPPPVDWEVVVAVVGIVVTVILVGAAYFSSRSKRGQIKNLLDEIDDAFFRFKRNSKRCEAELYRLKDIVVEQYKCGKITEGSYVILNERIDDYISKLSQP